MRYKRESVISGFSVVWAMRHDLPDVMLDEIEELRDWYRDLRDAEKREGECADWAAFGAEVDALCEAEGYPAICGEPESETAIAA